MNESTGALQILQALASSYPRPPVAGSAGTLRRGLWPSSYRAKNRNTQSREEQNEALVNEPENRSWGLRSSGAAVLPKIDSKNN